MTLTIEALRASGAFVGAPVAQDVTWHANGKPVTMTFYVRPESFHTITSKWESSAHGADAVVSRLVACIVTEDGQPLFTPADIVGDPSTDHGPLSAELTVALLAAIHRANGLGENKDDGKKKSRRKKNSGTT